METVRTITVPVAPACFFEVVTDFERYPDFLPNVLRCRILEHAPNRWRVAYTVHVLKRFAYTLHHWADPPRALHWTLDGGTLFRSNAGSWTIDPGPEPNTTRATYRLAIELGLFVPRAVSRRLTEVVLPRTLEAFAAEARRRVGDDDGGTP